MNYFNTHSFPIKILYLSALLFVHFVCCAQTNKIRCTIVGKVTDSNYSKELTLVKEGQDPRIHSVRIPIENGNFQFELETDDISAYQLTFSEEISKGISRPTVFFAEPDTVSFILYPNDDHHNEASGGHVNTEFLKFKNHQEGLFNMEEIDAEEERLRDKNLFFAPEATNLMNKVQQSQDEKYRDSLIVQFQTLERDNHHLTAKAQELLHQRKEAYSKLIDWKTKQIEEHVSLVTFRELVNLLKMVNAPYQEPVPINVGDLISVFDNEYKTKYPVHSYTEEVEKILTSFRKIKKGGHYVDFSAEDFTGKNVRLSELLKDRDKVILINLWASWCGPCRRKGMELIPVYEKYKDRGFTVIGVARERKRESGINAAKQDKYPWINLLEINDQNRIWEIYGVGNSGGGTFLIDKSGDILAVSPDLTDLRKILAKELDQKL